MINGVFCHETGCPNSRKQYRYGAWIRIVECRECGSEVEEGTECQECRESEEERWIDAHSVNCINCGALVDERVCITGFNGEGDVCPKCQEEERQAPSWIQRVDE
jgi:hypothetical protein